MRTASAIQSLDGEAASALLQEWLSANEALRQQHGWNEPPPFLKQAWSDALQADGRKLKAAAKKCAEKQEKQSDRRQHQTAGQGRQGANNNHRWQKTWENMRLTDQKALAKQWEGHEAAEVAQLKQEKVKFSAVFGGVSCHCWRT